MRKFPLILLGVYVVTGYVSQLRAEEAASRFKWWPLGGDATAADSVTPESSPDANTASANAAPSSVPDDSSEPSWLFQSPLANVSWPELKMPKFEWKMPNLPHPHLWPSDEGMAEVRNAWTSRDTLPVRPSPWQVVTDSAQKFGESTRTAWHKTVDVFSFTDREQATPRVAQREPFWKRMMPSEDDEPEGPRTVTEWMAQERINP